MLDATESIVEGSESAGVFLNGESGAYGVILNGDKIGMFGSDISSARKVLSEKTGGQGNPNR